jgi:hypothetical protein
MLFVCVVWRLPSDLLSLWCGPVPGRSSVDKIQCRDCTITSGAFHIEEPLIVSCSNHILPCYSMDSWSNIFFDNDAQAHESSDSSDSDFDPFSINPSLSGRDWPA